MQYLGGKSRIAKPLAATILASTDSRACYVEPFVGAGSVAVRLAPHFEHAYLSDASPDLIELWRALQDGWVPPDAVTEDMYRFYRTAPVSAMRGFVGYGSSFGGKWFGGYVKENPPKRSMRYVRNSLLRNTEHLATADFFCLDYRDTVIPRDAVVYCDPPYRGTTKYTRLSDFDSDDFWKHAAAWSEYAHVFVTEYSAPEGWHPVWRAHPNVSIHKDRNTDVATEHLWMRSGL